MYREESSVSDGFGEIPGLNDMPDRKFSQTLYDAQNRQYVAHHWEAVTTEGWIVYEARRQGNPILYSGPNRTGPRWLPDLHGAYNIEPEMTEERRRLRDLTYAPLRDLLYPPEE